MRLFKFCTVLVVAQIIGIIITPMILPEYSLQASPSTTTITVESGQGQPHVLIEVPKGSKTIKGYIVGPSGKKAVTITVNAGSNSGSVSWK